MPLTRNTEKLTEVKRNYCSKICVLIFCIGGRCMQCVGCKSDDCGVCIFCKDKKKFGGPGKRKKACIRRACIAACQKV